MDGVGLILVLMTLDVLCVSNMSAVFASVLNNLLCLSRYHLFMMLVALMLLVTLVIILCIALGSDCSTCQMRVTEQVLQVQ